MGMAGLVFEPCPLYFEKMHNFERCKKWYYYESLIFSLVSKLEKTSRSFLYRYFSITWVSLDVFNVRYQVCFKLIKHTKINIQLLDKPSKTKISVKETPRGFS